MTTKPALTRRALCLAAVLALPLSAAAKATVGHSAPDFALRDSAGKSVRLSDFKGRYVVLEWTNPGCPFVQKHYGAQNMQGLQKEFTAKHVAWLSVSSTARGTADYLEPAALAATYRQWGAAPTHWLMDDAGQVGRAYGAKTTPHMFVIDGAGKLIYAGGIDDKRSANPADIPGAKNYVKTALTEAMAGKAVSTPSATPYGCSVKYDAI